MVECFSVETALSVAQPDTRVASLATEFKRRRRKAPVRFGGELRWE